MRVVATYLPLFLVTSTAFAVERVSPRAAAELVAHGSAELIDVREQDELEVSGLAEPALWIAKSEVDNRSKLYLEFVERLDGKKTLIFYCETGRRAGLVATYFEDLGFATMNMGGFDGWLRANLPVRRFAFGTNLP